MKNELAPPPELQSRIARALRKEGLLRSRRWPYAAAAMLVVGLLVFFLRREPPVQPRYILLLYETANFSGGSREEYSAWAQTMRPLIAGGEELAPPVLLTINDTATSPRLAGYFLIDAKDDATAARVAKACPHVKHGGGIALRKIVIGS
jgi:hypothetical protein